LIPRVPSSKPMKTVLSCSFAQMQEFTRQRHEALEYRYQGVNTDFTGGCAVPSFGKNQLLYPPLRPLIIVRNKPSARRPNLCRKIVIIHHRHDQISIAESDAMRCLRSSLLRLERQPRRFLFTGSVTGRACSHAGTGLQKSERRRLVCAPALGLTVLCH
jgi:hypothetical protein